MHTRQTNIFEDAFISLMNILGAEQHVLFNTIVTNKDGTAKYPMKRAWVKLSSLTIAWHIHHPCPDESEDEQIEDDDLLPENVENEVVDSNDNGSELNDSNLEDDQYEGAFGTLMQILSANNFPLFEIITDAASSEKSVGVYDDGDEDSEIIKLGYAWKIWCDQNTYKCSVEDFEKMQNDDLKTDS